MQVTLPEQRSVTVELPKISCRSLCTTNPQFAIKIRTNPRRKIKQDATLASESS
jgi:hypothetical protein